MADADQVPGRFFLLVLVDAQAYPTVAMGRSRWVSLILSRIHRRPAPFADGRAPLPVIAGRDDRARRRYRPALGGVLDHRAGQLGRLVPRNTNTPASTAAPASAGRAPSSGGRPGR